MLNELLQWDDENIRQLIRDSRKNTKYITFFVNVGRSGTVFFGSPKRPGNHWTLLYIDLTINTWYYCDPYGWGQSKDMKAAVLPIVSLFYEETTLKLRPFKGCMEGPIRDGSKQGTRSLRNLSIQTCGNVCGVTVAILGGIASVAPTLWRGLFPQQYDRNA